MRSIWFYSDVIAVMLVVIDPESHKEDNGVLTSLLSSPRLPAWVEVAILNKLSGKCISRKIISHLISVAIFSAPCTESLPLFFMLYNIVIPLLEYSVFVDMPLKSIHFSVAFAIKNKIDLFFKRFIGSQSVIYTLLLCSLGWFGPQGTLVSARFLTTCYSRSLPMSWVF